MSDHVPGIDRKVAKNMNHDFAESIGDGIIWSDESGNIRHINQVAKDMFGYSSTEIIGQSIATLIPEAIWTSHVGGFAEWRRDMELLDAGKRLTLAGLRKDGREVTIQLTLSDVRFSGHHFIVAVLRDVTEEEGARESLRLLKAAVEAAYHSTLIADLDGRIIWANSAFTTMTGYELDEVVGKKTSLLKSGEQRPEYYAELWQTVLGGETWHGNLINRRKNGTVYLEKQTITPVVGESGAIAHFIAVKEDVTEAVQAGEMAQQAHDKYQRLFDSSPMAIFEEDFSRVKTYIDRLQSTGVTDLRAYFDAHPDELKLCASMIEILDVNSAAIKMVGAGNKDDVLGNLAGIFNDASYDNLKDELVWLSAGNLYYETEAENKTLSGENIVFDLKLSIASECSSCWSNVTVSLTDITDRKRRERQLQHSMKMEAVGRLTGGIAHDFNNVLTVISGNLRLITDLSGHEMGKDTKEMISDVLSAADDGAQLTTRLLAFSRKPVSASDKFIVDEAVLDFVELMKRTLSTGIEITSDLSCGPAELTTDRSSLGNALLNLSLNARDAMGDGGTLSIKASNGSFDRMTGADPDETAEPAPCVIIEVADTGVGMSPAVLEKAIEPFFTTKPIADGNGLGLSMVQDFARECGGDLKIESAVGQGTTVTLHLPCRPINSVSGPSVSSAGALKL